MIVMCISPFLIKNPNRGMIDMAKSSKVKGYFDIMSLKDLSSAYIQVPCGHCPQCVSLRQSHWVQRCQLMSFDHALFFATLTYSNDMIPRKEVIIEDKRRYLKYADKDDIQKFFKRLRNCDFFGRPFSYMCVSEFGKSTHRPHWHIIFAVKKLPDDNEFTYLSMESDLYMKLFHMWARNLGSDRKPRYFECSKFIRDPKTGKPPFDFHYLTINNNGFDDVFFYVSKYILKVDPYVERLHSALKINYHEAEFKKLWSLVKPKFFTSKRFGYPDTPEKVQFVRKCIYSSSDFPTFYSPFSGHASPMAPYIRKDFLSVEDVMSMNFDKYMNSPTVDTISYTDYEPDDVKRTKSQFKNVTKLVSQKNSHLDV